MRKCELCREFFPEEDLRRFIRYLGRFIWNYACTKCIEEHSVPKWVRGAPILAYDYEETWIEYGRGIRWSLKHACMPFLDLNSDHLNFFSHLRLV